MIRPLALSALAAVLLAAAPARADQAAPAARAESSKITISAPADIAKLRGKAQHIGSVTIINYGGADLSGLETLSMIDGDLIIFSSSGLTSLKGLEGLEVVTGRVSIFSNPRLGTLEHLARFREVKKGIEIHDNPSLTRLLPRPLTIGEPIHKLKGFISISRNRKLGNAAARAYVDSCTFRGGEGWIKRAEDNDPLASR